MTSPPDQPRYIPHVRLTASVCDQFTGPGPPSMSTSSSTAQTDARILQQKSTHQKISSSRSQQASDMPFACRNTARRGSSPPSPSSSSSSSSQSRSRSATSAQGSGSSCSPSSMTIRSSSPLSQSSSRSPPENGGPRHLQGGTDCVTNSETSNGTSTPHSSTGSGDSGRVSRSDSSGASSCSGRGGDSGRDSPSSDGFGQARVDDNKRDLPPIILPNPFEGRFAVRRGDHFEDDLRRTQHASHVSLYSALQPHHYNHTQPRWSPEHDYTSGSHSTTSSSSSSNSVAQMHQQHSSYPQTGLDHLSEMSSQRSTHHQPHEHAELSHGHHSTTTRHNMHPYSQHNRPSGNSAFQQARQHHNNNHYNPRDNPLQRGHDNSRADASQYRQASYYERPHSHAHGHAHPQPHPQSTPHATFDNTAGYYRSPAQHSAASRPPTPQQCQDRQSPSSSAMAASRHAIAAAAARRVAQLDIDCKRDPKQLVFVVEEPGQKSTAVKPVKEHQECMLCHTSTTPQWRRGPDGRQSLCNACGLHYYKILKSERKKKKARAIE